MAQIPAENPRGVADMGFGVEDVEMPEDIELAAGRAERQRHVLVFAL
jgi:hypothetical protein